MKIALCLFGQARDVKESFPYWDLNLLQKHDVDVYAHTWISDSGKPDLSCFNPVIHVSEPQKDFGLNFVTSTNIRHHDRSLVPSAINPQISRQKLLVRSPDREWYANPHNTLSMLYSRHQSNFLRKIANEPYDFIVSSRTDVCLGQPLPFHHLSRDIHPMTVTVPQMGAHHPGSRVEHFACDHILIARPAAMDIACDTYHYYHQLYFLGVDSVPEMMLGAQIIRTGDVKLYKAPLDYKLWRDGVGK